MLAPVAEVQQAGGATACFADGSAHFIVETIAPVVMRTLVTRSENDLSDWTP